MKKGLIDSLIIAFIILGLGLVIVKANFSVAVKNLIVEKSNTTNQTQNENYLDLVKSPFDTRLIEEFTGEQINYEDVIDGVYVFGVKGGDSIQTFYIFSKDSTSATQNLKVKVENGILKIFVVEAKNKTDSEKPIIYLAHSNQSPELYQVYRNNHLEKSQRFGYGIE